MTHSRDNRTALSPQNQMDLFELLEDTEDYSNTIDLYDALPKYNWNQKEHDNLLDAKLQRTVALNNKTYKVIVRPAIIDKPDGRSVLIYPGVREELVEDALRKFAVSGQGQMIEDGQGFNAGVYFTLYQLQKELRSQGRTYDINELKEAIQVCRGATLECYTEARGAELVINSSFFTLVGLSTRADYMTNPDSARCYVVFNPLVTRSISNLTFRKYNYKVGMEINSPLARFLYKRMSQHWPQASTSNPYTPSLMSFLPQTPRGLSKRMSENIRAMKNALESLQKHNIIRDWKEDRVIEGRNVRDVRYTIWASDRFISQAIEANKARNELKKKREEALARHSLITNDAEIEHI